MIGVLVISHEPLGTALIHCTRHIFGQMPAQLAALDVIPDEDPAGACQAAHTLAARINDGSGVLVLTDLPGATPSRIAASLAEPNRAVVIAGVNLPLLVKALAQRKGQELEALVDKLLPTSRDAIAPMMPGELGLDKEAAYKPNGTKQSGAKQHGTKQQSSSPARAKR